MSPTIGVNLRVTGHCNQGGRKYMEDAFVVAYQQTENEKDLEYAYFGIFDGHGGREAALFAKEHLMSYIVNQKNFWSEDDTMVLKAIRDGFITTHLAMWKEVGKWPKTMSGLPSTSGTTSSVAFIRRSKLYIGHVGDSKIVLGFQEAGSDTWLPKSLTNDHKPESAKEKERIYRVGGLVMSKAGVERVVWNRPRIGHQGPIRRSTHFDQIPFLAVARSLGDLWSYNYSRGEFVVSPEPDVSVVTLDTRRARCIILASDGLWNMVSTREAVRIVQNAEEKNEQIILDDDGAVGVEKLINPSKSLVDKALDLWYVRGMRADNTSVVTVLLDPPGPPRSKVLMRQKIMQKLRPRDEPEDLEMDSVRLVVDAGESKPVKKFSVSVGSAKLFNDLPPSKEFPKSNLPKPVVLSPRQVKKKASNGKGKNVFPSECNEISIKKEVENDVSSQTNNLQFSEDSVPSIPDSSSDHATDLHKIKVEDSESCVSSSTSSSKSLSSSSELRDGDSQLCENSRVKENEQNVVCDSCKSLNTDFQKESSRTHLSEVDNIVKIENIEDRLSERSKSVPRTQENKSKINEDILHKLADNRVSSSPHKRKGFGDSDVSVPPKTLKLDGSSWMRDTVGSCQVTAVRELAHNTRSQQRSRKVKVR